MEPVISNHDCTRQQNYSIAQMMITSGIANQPALFAYKKKYTLPYFAAEQGRLDAARLLPGEVEIKFIHVTLHIDLIELRKPCCLNFQMLKGNIKDGFPKNQLEALYELAGGGYYATSINNNWDDVASMNGLMKAFVLNPGRLAALLAGDNMNATFPLQINDDSDAFDLLHASFLTARQTGVATNTKLTADNGVHTDYMDLCGDAQIALVGFPELLKLFVFATVKDIVSPPGSASYKLDAEMDVTFVKKAGLIVTIQAAGQVAKTLTTDVNGNVHFEHLDPAKYTVTITGVGIITQTFKKDVDTGTNAHSEVLMELVPPPPPPPAV